ncbi:glycosyltransferase [Coprobacillus cateniformis]|jgi:glycosyltransferase involved in cell wall biosynthesis|uniref:glycosyltransferase n=1 Tax=Coprobacillus cateniformis TaxID=100884 RepID=UPI0034A477EF
MYENSIINNCPKFSVLMSLYYKENPKYLRQCLESLLSQTIQASEWVIVKDGPLTDELEEVLRYYDNHYPNLIKYVIFERNQGLGLALRAGVEACTYDLIARMDTDDVCVAKRFEVQINEFIKDSELDICGSYIKEFDGNINNIISQRKVPLSNIEIIKYQKKRSAFNHVTVMFKKEAVVDSGNYENCLLMEDDMLWVRMILNKCKMKNIDDYLVLVRVGSDMFQRRGGIKYFCKFKNARKKIYKLKFINIFNYYYVNIIQLVICLIPVNIRKYIFIKYLRKEV